jgi:hypothetical protein
MWNNIHPVTAFLSITSFLMNFSTTTIINLSLDANVLMGFVFIKTLAKASGYIGKFLVGWISDLFQCNKLILRIGYGSIFIIKPMFYLAMMAFFQDPVSNQYLLIIADCLDQFFNNFRDISRDAMIARTVKNNHLPRNLFFRKASSIGGTMIGAIVSLYISLFHTINQDIFGALSVILMIAVITSIIGYAFLSKALSYVEDKVQATKFHWSNVLDIRLWSLMVTLIFLVLAVIFKIPSLITLISSAILLLTYAGSSVLHYIYYAKREENRKHIEESLLEDKTQMCALPPSYALQHRMYLFDNRTFVFVGILSIFLSLFSVNYYSLIDVFKRILMDDSNMASKFTNKPWKQTMAIIYYLISFGSSSVLSVFNMKRISNILLIYLLSFITIGSMILTKTFAGFIVAIIAYGIVNGTFESAISAYVIRHTQKFAYKGITLGLFSVFNSIGILLMIVIGQFLGDIYKIYHLSLVGNISIACILLILSYFKKDKLKEI